MSESLQLAGNNEVRTIILQFGREQNQCVFMRQVWYVVDFPECYVNVWEENKGKKILEIKQ